MPLRNCRLTVAVVMLSVLSALQASALIGIAEIEGLDLRIGPWGEPWGQGQPLPSDLRMGPWGDPSGHSLPLRGLAGAPPDMRIGPRGYPNGYQPA